MAAMQEGSWRSLSSGRKLALAAGLSVGATVGYMVYRHIRSSGGETARHRETSQSRFSVPLEVYRALARHQSTFLGRVSDGSGAQVSVVPDPDDPGSVTFLLQGQAEQVLLARCSLERLASDSQPITDVLDVPQTAFGRIIGRGGETLKLMCRTSGARINLPRERGYGPDETGRVTIMGTREEVQRAKDLIMEKVLENETVRSRISQASALRQKRGTLEPDPEPRRTPGPDDPPPSVSENSTHLSPGSETSPTSPTSPPEYSKFEIPSPDLSFQPGEHLEVYVSASENPQHFWIQIIGVRSLQLDQLTSEMSRFYNDALQEHRVESMVVGDIVAAPYRNHGTWNRARVLGVLGSGLVDLYYVDFGDNGELERDQLRSMRSDFLSLPFQAMECSLAGVRPVGESWTCAALDDFERLTRVAQWEPLHAQLCSYAHNQLCSWPRLQLYHTTAQGETVDLGEEMIRLGHAVSSLDVENEEREDQDEPRSLQKLLDDMTGATSELSLSCISLSEVASISGSVDDVLEDDFN